jgi:presenilin-like A22 family membrane protease
VSETGDAGDAVTVDESDEGDESEGSHGFDPGPAVGIFALFAATILGGLALVGPFETAGLQAFEDPSNLGNVGILVVWVLIATGLFLAAFHYGLGDWVIRALVIGALSYILYTPVAAFLPSTIPSPAVVAVLPAGVVAAVLWVHPEWYVVNVAGVAFGVVAVALFGAGLSPLPAICLLVVLAMYDAYSVYVSEHMQSLGGGVVDLALPMVFVVPGDLSFSLRETEDLESLAAGAMVLGLGDAIFPGVLAASGAVFLDAPTVVAGLNAPALGALLGAFVGLVGLNYVLFRVQRTHAGLPILNGTVIAGYLMGALAGGVPLVEAVGLGPYL